ncbi:MAG: hypothetical protein US42_C0023G0005 [Candidatus Magasanikbacteria bacterium GW2011_GWC2_37_14]|uniref:Uncharacterized protein n=1 Tax=Candidatus Magasanikbacteria bacterium GW2011_GWC2_37_14 TaxID=1619046 RepID=A0A0G0G9Z6_9BACT|nr:MAG: hypothetical protein US42_C0023G0005 [Candidatus Magasanikbacteria bacterium GW2011_GWC2_37_14]
MEVKSPLAFGSEAQARRERGVSRQKRRGVLVSLPYEGRVRVGFRYHHLSFLSRNLVRDKFRQESTYLPAGREIVQLLLLPLFQKSGAKTSR